MHMVSQSAEDTRAIAERFAERIKEMMGTSRQQALVVALRGELGAGKTTFVQGFTHALGITHVPKSPTFLFAKEYAVPGTAFTVWHLDCYRLEGHQALITLDLHHLFDIPTNILLIEWPERIGDGLPRDHIEIHMEHAGDDRRSITISEA